MACCSSATTSYSALEPGLLLKVNRRCAAGANLHAIRSTDGAHIQTSQTRPIYDEVLGFEMKLKHIQTCQPRSIDGSSPRQVLHPPPAGIGHISGRLLRALKVFREESGVREVPEGSISIVAWPNLAPRPLEIDGVRLTARVAPTISPVDQF